MVDRLRRLVRGNIQPAAPADANHVRAHRHSQGEHSDRCHDYSPGDLLKADSREHATVD